MMVYVGVENEHHEDGENPEKVEPCGALRTLALVDNHRSKIKKPATEVADFC